MTAAILEDPTKQAFVDELVNQSLLKVKPHVHHTTHPNMCVLAIYLYNSALVQWMILVQLWHCS